MLFDIIGDAVVIVEDRRIVAWNAGAELLLGVSAQAALSGAPTPLDPHLPALLELSPDARLHRTQLGPLLTVDVTRRTVDGREVLLLHDVTAVLRREAGLSRLAALSRELLGSPMSVAETLQSLVETAKSLTCAAYSALLLLREGSLTETSHFVYDAPRELFPSRMPRTVGLLSVPLATGCPARLDSIVGVPGSVGLPGVHPPIGPLLAVPLMAGDAPIGEIAVAGPPGARTFDEVDEALLVDFAAHASAAVRWTLEAERTREVELVRREVLDAARHDIRTPLGAGKGYASLLATRMDRMSPEQIAMALAGLASSFSRIEAFSARLLVDDRLNASAPELRWQEVDVVELLECVRRDATAMTGREDAVLVSTGPGAPTTLAGDGELVREVVENLVGNALKYAGTAGPVTVSVRREGEQVRLDVRDVGPGIAEDEQAGLFERWSRTGASRDAMVPGLGLGLSIVKRLVLAHGGLLGVSSRPGEGATFWVTFPAVAPAQAAPAPVAPDLPDEQVTA